MSDYRHIYNYTLPDDIFEYENDQLESRDNHYRQQSASMHSSRGNQSQGQWRASHQPRNVRDRDYNYNTDRSAGYINPNVLNRVPYHAERSYTNQRNNIRASTSSMDSFSSSYGISPSALTSSPTSDEDYDYQYQARRGSTVCPSESSNSQRYGHSHHSPPGDIRKSSVSRDSKSSSTTRHYCPVNGCVDDKSHKQSSFSRSADLKRHIQSIHHDGKTIDCEIKKCRRKGEDGFSRKDHYIEHLRGYHNLDIAKRASRG